MDRRWFLKATLISSYAAKQASGSAASDSDMANPKKHALLQTPSGVRFGLVGRKPAVPAPTIFLFSTRMQYSLERADYRVAKVGWILADHGFLSVSLDCPCEGEDVKGGESEG